jgi:hypothetical protein
LIAERVGRSRGGRLVAAIFAPCSGAKSVGPIRTLRAPALSRATQPEVSQEWLRRLDRARGEVVASDYYVGRGYRGLQRLATTADVPLYVISAGLGLVPASRRVPPYDLTTTAGPASIVGRVKGQFDPVQWWSTVERSKFSERLAEVCSSLRAGRLLIVVSNQYAKLIGKAVEALPGPALDRCRLFGSGIAQFLPTSIGKLVMPYDRRLDVLVSGPMAEFPHRAASHFVSECTSSTVSVEGDRALVLEALARVRIKRKPTRRKMSDKEILDLIAAIGPEPSGSARKLRLVRDRYLVACESGRFNRLLREASL